MGTIAAMLSEVQEAVGGRSDSIVNNAAYRGFNAGLIAAANKYEPNELHANDTIVVSASGRFVDFTTSLTQTLRILNVENTSNSNKKVYFLPYGGLDSYPIPSGDNITFYSLHGKYMHVRPTPTAETTLRAFYIQYPDRIDSSTTDFPWTAHEDYVLMFGKVVAMAVLEESESSEIWSKIGDKLGLTEDMVEVIDRALKGEYLPNANV